LGTGLVETNIQFETEVLETLKQKELSSAALQTKIQKICDEREDLADQLLEHEKSIMLFEKKLQIAREMKEALDPNYGSAELSAMRREVSRMELRLQQIVKQQQQIVKEIEFALRRRDTIRNRAIVTKRLNKDRTRSDLSKGITELSRDVKKLNVEIKQLSNGVEVNLQAVDELRTNVDQLQHILNERQITKNQLDNDIKNLEKDKIRNQALLEQVQARTTMFSGTSRKTSIKSAENYQQAIEKLQTQSQKLSELIDSLTQNFPQYADRFHLAKVRGFLE
jgi:chromosome segregation ATPase